MGQHFTKFIFLAPQAECEAEAEINDNDVDDDEGGGDNNQHQERGALTKKSPVVEIRADHIARIAAELLLDLS